VKSFSVLYVCLVDGANVARGADEHSMDLSGSFWDLRESLLQGDVFDSVLSAGVLVVLYPCPVHVHCSRLLCRGHIRPGANARRPV